MGIPVQAAMARHLPENPSEEAGGRELTGGIQHVIVLVSKAGPLSKADPEPPWIGLHTCYTMCMVNGQPQADPCNPHKTSVKLYGAPLAGAAKGLCLKLSENLVPTRAVME